MLVRRCTIAIAAMKAIAQAPLRNMAGATRAPSVDRVTGVPAMTVKPPWRTSQPVPAMNPPITGNGTKRTRLPSLKKPRRRTRSPVANVATMVAATTLTKVASAVACPAMLEVIAPTMPPIATTGTSCTTETAPRIGLVNAATKAPTTVEKSAMPIAAGRKRKRFAGSSKLAKLIDNTIARNPQTTPATRVLNNRSKFSRGRTEIATDAGASLPNMPPPIRIHIVCEAGAAQATAAHTSSLRSSFAPGCAGRRQAARWLEA